MEHRSKFIRPELKVLDEDAGVIQAVVSTEDMDRDGDVIRQDYWNLDHFKSHPILLSSHNYRGLMNQIGEWTNMGVQDGKLIGTAKYYINEGNEQADWGFNLASKGRAAFSVGFVPDMSQAKAIDANGNLSYEFRGQELLEVSQVTVPSNPKALQTMKGMDLHPAVESLVDEMLADLEQPDGEKDYPKRKPKEVDNPFVISALPVAEIAHEMARLMKADAEVVPEKAVEKPIYPPLNQQQRTRIFIQAIKDSMHRMEEF
jgi:hypothetical protein